jgi:hypothetical protein
MTAHYQLLMTVALAGLLQAAGAQRGGAAAAAVLARQDAGGGHVRQQPVPRRDRNLEGLQRAAERVRDVVPPGQARALLTPSC